MTKDVDDLDRSLLQELKKNARTSAVQLANRLKVPRTTVVGRLDRLEREGIIEQYTVRVDAKKLGLPVKAFIMIAFSPAPGMDQRQVARRVAALPGVEEVNIISGDWDILVAVRAATIESIGDLVLDKIRREPGIARTLTITCFATIKEP